MLTSAGIQQYYGYVANDGLAPLQTISIVSLVLGVLLIAAAIVYPSMMQKEAE